MVTVLLEPLPSATSLYGEGSVSAGSGQALLRDNKSRSWDEQGGPRGDLCKKTVGWERRALQTKLGGGRMREWGSKKRLRERKQVQGGSSLLCGVYFQGECWERISMTDLLCIKNVLANDSVSATNQRHGKKKKGGWRLKECNECPHLGPDPI